MENQTLPEDAVVTGYDPATFKIRIKSVVVTPPGSVEPGELEKLREETKEKYSGIHGKKYAIIFYEIKEKQLEITDFFRAVLIDPNFYVYNLLHKHGILAAVAEEFTLNENWSSKAEKESDEGLFIRLVELTDLFWHNACNLLPQATKEKFQSLTNSGNSSIIVS